MEQQFDFEVLVKLKSKKRRKIWKRILSAMMCVVVFCTTYMLILPAITKENQAFCGIDEHTHNEKCYEKTLLCEAHVHTEECFTPQTNLICTEPTDDGHTHGEACHPVTELQLCCDLAESEGHTHTDSCMVTETVLVCSLEETPGHTHGEACDPVTETQLCCGLAESEGHTHTDSCMVTETVLNCQLEESAEHTHGDGCYTAVASLACGMEEAPGHVHGDDCYTTTTIYGCGQEEAAGHTHTDACYTEVTTCGCGLEEAAGHTHTDACYTEVTIYGCGLEETPPSHVHTDTCYETIQQNCPVETAQDHEHTDACYSQTLICTREEHTHSVACFSDPSADLESVSTWEATLPELTGSYSQDILAIAQSQLGYTESSRNYIVDENGDTKGYTRYGAWYGIPYGDWCAMFVSFCLHYASVEEMPINACCSSWISDLEAAGLYEVPSEYIPKAGDIIFFDWENDGRSDHVGLVETLDGTNVTTIEGNMGNCVARHTYELLDSCIIGYGVLTQPQAPVEEPAENEEATYLDKENTKAWVELVGESQQAEPVAEVTQEESVQPVAEEAGTSRMRFFGGASTFGLTGSTWSSRAASEPLDLTPYINTVAMYDGNGKPIPNGAVVTEGDLIEFKIEYTVTGQQLGILNGEVVEQITDTLTYSLPKTFQIVQDDSGEILNAAGSVVGSYVIDSESGTITMVFTDDYVEQNAKGIQIHGYISFFSAVTKVTDEDGEHQDFKFTDKITLGIVIEEEIEAEGDLSIEKQKASVSGEEIIYEIKVTSTEGTKGPITITDQMSTGLTFKEGISVQEANGTTVQGATFNPSADRSSFTMTLPEMKAGETYTIRYRCQADINLLDANMTVQNTATVTGKDSQDNELKDRTTVEHNFDVLKKTGKQNDDGSITWTITINQAKADISGWTLEDIMRDGPEQVPYTGPVTIQGSSGNIVANNVRLPYKFPNGSKDTYTITYTTTHDFGSQGIYNSAILSDDNTDVEVTTGVVVGTPFTKSGEAGDVIQDENGNYLLPITWTVTIDTRNGAIPGGLVFTDKFQGYPTDDMYITYDQMMDALANFEDELVRVSGQKFAWFTAWVYAPGPESSDTVYQIPELWDNVDGCQSMVFDRFAFLLGDKGIPQGNVLTFSYETYGIFPNNIVSTTTFKNRFYLNEQYEVEAKVDYVENTIKGTKYAISYFDPETQKDDDWFWSSYEYDGVEGTSEYEYNKLKDSYLAWAIELSTPLNYSGSEKVIVYEDLPEGVSVKGVSLSFNSNLPTATLRQWDMVPGQTYTWEFPLYTAEQYYYWNHQNPQTVAIEVKLTEAGDLEITIPDIIFETVSEYAGIHNTELRKQLSDEEYEKQKLTEWFSFLHIFTQINDDFEWPPQEEGSFVYVNNFENRFTIKNENDVVIDIGSQTQKITKDERDGMLKKVATTDSKNNIVKYAVVLNAYKKDLIENSGFLTIHDELTYSSTDAQPLRMRLVPGSVKLYEIRMKSDGSYEKLGEVTANYKYDENSYTQYGITHWSHTIDMNVPDSTALVLEYSYKASGNQNSKHNVQNTCSISGVGQGNLEGDSQIEIEVKDATAQADITGVMLYKVDANSDGIFLENAKFNIYIWNEDVVNADGTTGNYIIVHHPNNGDTTFTTDTNGMIVLDKPTMDDNQFAYNTAYYIVEIESPAGYYLGPEPYYFYIKHNDTTMYPTCIPGNFEGRALTSGDIIYRQNVSELTEITVEKYWKDYNGESVTVTGEEVSSVKLELWQMIQGDPGSAAKFGTYTMTPDENGNWKLTIKNLPKATKNADGTRGTNYLYFIKEVSVGGYELESAENNSGINYGTIQLVNKEMIGYILPETGGAGTQMYTMAGLLLMLTSAAFLTYINVKRRREAL